MNEKVKQAVEDKKRDYQQAFGSPAGQRVLKDLMSFCYAVDGCYAEGDANETMLRLGAHEVWLHICRHLNLSTDKLFAVYMGQTVNIGEADG